MWRRLLQLALGVSLAAAPFAWAAAQDFPARPITIVIGLSAGGITDVTTRLYADVVSRALGQRILIDNRPTGAGAVAAANVQQAAPDGYTLLAFSGAQHAVLPAMQPVPYDPIKGFQPVTTLFTLVNFLVVPKDSSATSVRELLELGRKKPGGLSFGSSGVGSPSHLTAARLALSSKTPIEAVQYRGGSAMIPDLVAGRLDFALVSLTVAKPYVLDGKLKLLAVDSDRRWPDLPDVPTLPETGVEQPRVASWFGLAAPAGTPVPIVHRIREAFVQASRDPDLMRRLHANGTLITTSTPQEMEVLMAQEVERTGALVHTLNLRPQ